MQVSKTTTHAQEATVVTEYASSAASLFNAMTPMNVRMTNAQEENVKIPCALTVHRAVPEYAAQVNAGNAAMTLIAMTIMNVQMIYAIPIHANIQISKMEIRAPAEFAIREGV
jgi:hypothetical protein